MKGAYALMALAGAVCAVAVAGCDHKSTGWDPVMECTQRDLGTGLCTAATYSCAFETQQIAYYVDGPRCFLRKGAGL